MMQLYGILMADQALTLEPPLQIISSGLLKAVVGEAAVNSYRDLPPSELMPYLGEYQTTLAHLCQQGAVLPVQFGSLLHSKEQVEQVLRAHQEAFERVLAQLGAMSQFELVLRWDARAILTEIANSMAVQQVKDELAGHPPNEIRAAQEGLRRQVQIAFVQRQAELEQAVRLQMQGLTKTIIKLPQTDDNMAAHLALVFPQAELERGRSLLENLRQRVQMKCQLEWTGPLYPRDLATVVVRVPNLSLVTHARELLGLGETADLQEIRTAYYNHKYYIRPDQNSDLDSIVNMLELAQAYKLLKELAENQGGEVCRMDSDAVQQTIAVNLLYTGETTP